MGWRVGGRAAAGAHAHRRAVFVADGGGAAPSGSIDARGAGGAARGLLLLVLQLVGDPKAQGRSTGRDLPGRGGLWKPHHGIFAAAPEPIPQCLGSCHLMLDWTNIADSSGDGLDCPGWWIVRT